jgi:hypothetical protein
MTEVTINVPTKIAALPLPERNSLIRASLFEAVQSRIRQLVAEIEESKQQIQAYEKKYGASLTQFELEQLPDLDDMQVHEDYNDWLFWTEILQRDQQIMADLQKAEVK